MKGLNKFEQAVAKWPRISAPIFQRALQKSVNDFLRISQPLTPIDTGRLRGAVSAGVTYRPLEATIHPNLEYALPVHERTDIPHRGMTTSKYFEKAMKKAHSRIKGNFKEALKLTYKAIKRKTVI